MMLGRSLTKGVNGRQGSSAFKGCRLAGRRGLILALEELERRQLLSLAVAQVRGSVTGGVIDQREGPTSAEIAMSDHGSSYDPYYKTTSSWKWSSSASVRSARQGDPIGIDLEISSTNSASITASSKAYGYAAGNFGAGAEWEDTFIIPSYPILKEHPIVRLTLQTSYSFEGTTPRTSEWFEQTFPNYVALGITSNGKVLTDQSGKAASYLTYIFGNSDIPVPGSITVEVPVGQTGALWSGSFHIGAEVANYGPIAIGTDATSTAHAELSVKVVSASLADGTVPDFSPVGSSLIATGLEYVQGEATADDLLKIDYSTLGPDTSGKVPSIDVYWSRSPDFADRISSAYRFDAAAGNGPHTKLVLLNDLAQRPGPDAKYLLLHVDSSLGTKYAGEITEVNEDDNFASHEIRHDVQVASAAFNSQLGGLDVAYAVSDRFWFPGPINVDLFWGTNKPASTTHQADPGLRVLHVAAKNFVPPTIQDDGVRVVFDAKDFNPGNDQSFAPLFGLAPTIELTTFGRPERKHNFDVIAKVTNNAPVPMRYRIGYREIGPEFVRDTASLSDRLDSDSSTVKAVRSADGVELFLAYGASDTRNLGSLDGLGPFNRTWNWVPSFKFYQDLLLQLAGLNSDAATGKVVELILSRLKVSTGGIGAELVKQAVSKLAGTALPESVDTKDQVPIDYHVDVTTLASSGIVTGQDKTVTLNVQPLQRTAFNNFQTLFEFTLQEAQAALSAADRAADSKNPATQASAVAALALASAQYVANVQSLAKLYGAALDPPDPNHTQIAIPTPTFAMPAGLDPSGPWWDVARILVDLSGLESAILTTIDRIQGAEESGNAAWEAAQRLALSDFAGRASLLYGDLIAAEASADAATPQASSDQYAALKADVAANGLPAALVTALQQAGGDAQAIKLFADLIVRTPNRLTDVPGASAATRALQADLMSGMALEELTRGTAIRTTVLGQPVLPVPGDQSQALQARRDEITSLLASGAPSDQIRARIADYVDLVRSLIDHTNNVEALRADLEFGYGALSQKQALDVSAAAIATPPTDSAEPPPPPGDATGPTILDLRRLGIHAHPTRLILTFAESLDRARAENLVNYHIVAPGPDGRFGTRDDRVMRLRSAVYDPATHTVTLLPSRRLNWHRRFQITVTGTGATGITSEAGNLMDGDYDGKVGGDYVVTFRKYGPVRGRPFPIQTRALVGRGTVHPNGPVVRRTSHHPRQWIRH